MCRRHRHQSLHGNHHRRGSLLPPGDHPPVVRTLAEFISERARQQATMRGTFRQGEDPYGFKLRTDSPVQLLVLSCGSSSLKYNFYDTRYEIHSIHGVIENVGEEGTCLHQVSALSEKVENLPRGRSRQRFRGHGGRPNGGRRTADFVRGVVAVGHRVAAWWRTVPPRCSH